MYKNKKKTSSLKLSTQENYNNTRLVHDKVKKFKLFNIIINFKT